MTAEQFQALAALVRAREPVRTAARSVLVDGMRQTDAAALHGVTTNSLNNAVQRMRRTLVLAQTAAGVAPS